jgi:hypothetical protein
MPIAVGLWDPRGNGDDSLLFSCAFLAFREMYSLRLTNGFGHVKPRKSNNSRGGNSRMALAAL